MQAVMGEEERLNLERQIRDGSTRPAAHAERVSRGSQRAPQRGARQAAARGAAASRRSMRARRSSTSSLADAIFVSTAVDITAAVIAAAAIARRGSRAPAPAKLAAGTAQRRRARSCSMAATLGELADEFGCELHGDPAVVVSSRRHAVGRRSRRHHVSRQSALSRAAREHARGRRHS